MKEKKYLCLGCSRPGSPHPSQLRHMGTNGCLNLLTPIKKKYKASKKKQRQQQRDILPRVIQFDDEDEDVVNQSSGT